MSTRLQIFILFLALQITSPLHAIDCGPTLRKIALLTVAPITEAEKYIYIAAPPIAMVWSGAPKWAAYTYVAGYLLWKTHFGNKIPSTGRGVMNYLSNLRLLNYDFTGKKILDVGSGHSRFAQVVDGIYRATGTQATALDKQVQPAGRNSVKADATNMPFKDGEFDLVVSSWAYTYWHETKVGFNALNEMIRVAKPAGEIRLRVLRSSTEALTDEYLANHPNVESFSYQVIPALTEKLLVIKLKSEPKTTGLGYHQDWLELHPEIKETL